MTIQDALERAKRLGEERSASKRVPVAETRPSSVARETTVFEVPANFPALSRIEFDVAACLKNKIILTSAQLSAGGAGAAAYRMMRGRVLQRIKSSKWSCIGMTSAGPGEGKTITTLNLAISIAREKLRTLYLLDLDMRKPGMWNRVGCQPKNQLSQYFAGELAAENVLYETSVENLVVAGNLWPTAGASELLASTRLDELLMYIRLRSPGALILIDLPPALSTDEALVVAPRMDGIFLVVSEGVTRRDGLARTIDMLSDYTVGGIILNRSTARLSTGYYGY